MRKNANYSQQFSPRLMRFDRAIEDERSYLDNPPSLRSWLICRKMSAVFQTRSFPPPTGRNRSLFGLNGTWEITITCRDGSRLRFSELRGHAPQKGEIFETADAGQIIKARIDAYREEKPEWLAPSLFPGHGDRNIRSAEVTTLVTSLRLGRDKNRGTAIDRQNLRRCHTTCDAERWSRPRTTTKSLTYRPIIDLFPLR